jgi:hypothetical protein
MPRLEARLRARSHAQDVTLPTRSGNGCTLEAASAASTDRRSVRHTRVSRPVVEMGMSDEARTSEATSPIPTVHAPPRRGRTCDSPVRRVS